MRKKKINSLSQAKRIMNIRKVITPHFTGTEFMNKRLIVILEQAFLETAKMKNGKYVMLTADMNPSTLSKATSNPSIVRPDILFDTVKALLDSPLNKAGLLQVFIRTYSGVLIKVDPSIRIPRTEKRFYGLLTQLLHKRHIRAAAGSTVLLQVIKNDIKEQIPPGTRIIGLTRHETVRYVSLFPYIAEDILKLKSKTDGDKESEEKIESKSKKEGEDDEAIKLQKLGKRRYRQYSKPSKSVGDIAISRSEKDRPVVFVIGSMASGSLKDVEACSYVTEWISISQYPLSAAAVANRVCHCFEMSTIEVDDEQVIHYSFKTYHGALILDTLKTLALSCHRHKSQLVTIFIQQMDTHKALVFSCNIFNTMTMSASIPITTSMELDGEQSSIEIIQELEIEEAGKNEQPITLQSMTPQSISPVLTKPACVSLLSLTLALSFVLSVSGATGRGSGISTTSKATSESLSSSTQLEWIHSQDVISFLMSDRDVESDSVNAHATAHVTTHVSGMGGMFIGGQGEIFGSNALHPLAGRLEKDVSSVRDYPHPKGSSTQPVASTSSILPQLHPVSVGADKRGWKGDISSTSPIVGMMSIRPQSLIAVFSSFDGSQPFVTITCEVEHSSHSVAVKGEGRKEEEEEEDTHELDEEEEGETKKYTGDSLYKPVRRLLLSCEGRDVSFSVSIPGLSTKEGKRAIASGIGHYIGPSRAKQDFCFRYEWKLLSNAMSGLKNASK
ncbi:Ribosomal biogenesis, methyltransferase, EMG1/NEP1 like protein, partial [Aduncisulcus paluster]